MLGIGFSVYLAAIQPDVGVEWSYQTGAVLSVSAPYQHLFQPGDTILNINQLALEEARFLPGMQAGEQVDFLIAGEPQSKTVSITLEKPGISVYLERFSIILIALLFSLISVAFISFTQLNFAIIAFFIFFQGLSLTLTSGVVSGYAPLWVVWLFNGSTWWVVSVGVLFQSVFLFSPLPKKAVHGLQFLFLVMSMFFAVYTLDFYFHLFPWIRLIQYPWIAFNFYLMILLVILKMRFNPTIQVRQKLAPVLFSSLAGFLPFILLTLLPEIIFGNPWFPGSFTLIPLIFIPLGYGYVILQKQFIPLETYISRDAAYAFLILFFSFLYFLVLQMASNLFLGSIPALFTFMLIVAFVVSYQPLYALFQRMFHHLFFGEYWDEARAVQRIQQAMKQKPSNGEDMAVILSEIIQKVLLLEKTTLILTDGRIFTCARSEFSKQRKVEPEVVLDLITAIEQKTTEKFGTGPAVFENLPVPATIKRTVSESSAWILIEGLIESQGLILLGKRQGGSSFEKKDWDLLEVLIRQARYAIENNLLNQTLQRHSKQIHTLNRKLFLAKEDEKKKVAFNLHATVIQSLLGLSYSIASLKRCSSSGQTVELEKIQHELNQIVEETRQVYLDLRPPALDSIGLIAAIQSFLYSIAESNDLKIHFENQLNPETEIPEERSISLYRVLQEAFVNIDKHAKATEVQIGLRAVDQRIELCIRDNGIGFQTPDSLGSLVKQNHFGLLGLQEMLSYHQGILTIQSAPGLGCVLVASVPGENDAD